MTTHAILILSALILLSLCINLPLGYLRERSQRFSLGWLFYVHASIPAVMLMRIKSGFTWKVIPLTLAAVVVGQLLGGKFSSRG